MSYRRSYHKSYSSHNHSVAEINFHGRDAGKDNSGQNMSTESGEMP